MSPNIQILDSARVIFPQVILCNKDESEAITSRMLEGAGMPELWEAVRDQNEKIKFLLFKEEPDGLTVQKLFHTLSFIIKGCLQ